MSFCTSLDVEGNLRVKTDVFGFYNQFGVDLTSFDNSLMATSMSERSPSRPGPLLRPAPEFEIGPNKGGRGCVSR